ncbi:MAG: peptidoglycan-binding protein [Alphaproteobacteria bacterium]|nr:MAG: peptidoglycan-binding protein [Alphaproteobacteria bacterium]
MIKVINALLVTTAICGLLAASPAKAANNGDDRTAGAMPTATTNDSGVAGSTGETSRTAGSIPTATTHDTGVVGSTGEKARTAGSIPAVNQSGPAIPPSTHVSASSTVKHTRLTNRDVTEIQKLLADKGFYKSKVDGQFGPGTQEAMRGYQSAEGLEANGFPTIVTLDKLGVTPENPSVTGDAEPTGKGGVIYTETVESKEITEKSGAGFVNIDTQSQNGGNCLHCTNGPIGNGGTKSMNSNAF